MLLPYAEQTVNPLSVLFRQDLPTDIPTFTIKNHSDFGLITSSLETLSEPIEVEGMFESIADYMSDTNNILLLQPIEYAAKAIAQAIDRNYEILNTTIFGTVESIRKDVDDRYATLMKRENAENLLDSTEVFESDYTIFNWGDLESPMVQNEIIESATINANLHKQTLSSMNLGYVTQKADFSSDFNTIKLPEDVEKTITDKISGVMMSVDGSSTITDSVVKNTWKMFTDKSSYITFCNRLGHIFGDHRNLLKNCGELLTVVSSIDTIGQSLSRIISDDVNVETLQTVTNNVTSVMKTSYAIRYWILAAKELTFKDKLILNKTTLNGPVYREFVQSGKTVKDVHTYLKAFHHDTILPIMGINVSTVMSSDAEKYLEKANDKIRNNANFIMKKCLADAYQYAIRQFVNKDETKKQFKQLSDQSFVTRFTTDATRHGNNLSGNIANLDGVLYKTVISSFYKDTLVEKIYNHTNACYENLVGSASHSLTEEDIIASQCTSVTNLVVDHLFANLVE